MNDSLAEFVLCSVLFSPAPPFGCCAPLLLVMVVCSSSAVVLNKEDNLALACSSIIEFNLELKALILGRTAMVHPLKAWYTINIVFFPMFSRAENSSRCVFFSLLSSPDYLFCIFLQLLHFPSPPSCFYHIAYSHKTTFFDRVFRCVSECTFFLSLLVLIIIIKKGNIISSPLSDVLRCLRIVIFCY